MEWNMDTLRVLEDCIHTRFSRFKNENKTDRKNLSEMWNVYLKGMDITLLRPKKKNQNIVWPVLALVEAINFRNEEVSDALCINNPDRPGQYIFVPRDIAAKIITLGMP